MLQLTMSGAQMSSIHPQQAFRSCCEPGSGIARSGSLRRGSKTPAGQFSFSLQHSLLTPLTAHRLQAPRKSKIITVPQSDDFCKRRALSLTAGQLRGSRRFAEGFGRRSLGIRSEVQQKAFKGSEGSCGETMEGIEELFVRQRTAVFPKFLLLAC